MQRRRFEYIEVNPGDVHYFLLHLFDLLHESSVTLSSTKLMKLLIAAICRDPISTSDWKLLDKAFGENKDEGHPTINDRDPSGSSALIWASACGNLPVVRTLIEKKADINLRNSNGNTALIWAAHNGNLPVVEFLIGEKADVMARNKYGGNAARNAAGSGYLTTLRKLMDHKADINAPGQYGYTSAMFSYRKEHPEITKWLLEAGARVDLPDVENKGLADHVVQKRDLKTLIKVMNKEQAHIIDTEVKEHVQVYIQDPSMMFSYLLDLDQSDPDVQFCVDRLYHHLKKIEKLGGAEPEIIVLANILFPYKEDCDQVAKLCKSLFPHFMLETNIIPELQAIITSYAGGPLAYAGFFSPTTIGSVKTTLEAIQAKLV